MAKILTESEVATIGETTTSYANRCCTATRANDLNCTVTSPSSPATNLLITGVSKKASDAPTITGSYTTYKNVSVGTSTNSDGDIPYYGGSHRAVATVTYEYATVTTYSNNTSTTGPYTSTSETIYGEWVNADGVNVTVDTPRTFIGYSTPSGTVAGATRTATAVAIYLEGYTTYNYEVSVTNITNKACPKVNMTSANEHVTWIIYNTKAGNFTDTGKWYTGSNTIKWIIVSQNNIKYITVIVNNVTVVPLTDIGGNSSYIFDLGNKSFTANGTPLAPCKILIYLRD